jgi:hypothetical protein
VTSPTTDGAISSGYFKLQLSVGGVSQTTKDIPFDAPAMMADEIGVTYPTTVQVTATNDSNILSVTKVGDVTGSVVDATEAIFKGNDIWLEKSINSQTVYQVIDVQYEVISGTLESRITLDEPVIMSEATATAQDVYRHLGGRNETRTSTKVACVQSAASDSFCPIFRERTSGSIESKLMYLGLTPGGLTVERDEAIHPTNGMTWRVTFLDDSPANPDDFHLSVVDESAMTTQDGTSVADVDVQIKSDGVVYEACTGDLVFPEDKTLQEGQLYYARVSAINEVGYGPALAATVAQKPMVTPSGPTSVVLRSVSKTELRVEFNPPVSNGGDAIVSYKIEYSTSQFFSESTTQSTMLTYLDGGSPFSKTISGLTTGTEYYVRVFALNSQGVGEPAVSTPDKLNPHEPPEGPSNVRLRITSNSMLTVGFDLPEYNGGDDVTHFKIEWDVDATFQSPTVPMPHKGSVEVDASTHRSHTLTLLTQGQQYYVRVAARNNAGYGTFTNAVPAKSIPALQTPGRPHTISATRGDSTGRISVSWQRPRVPFHGVPCSGTNAAPFDCPAEIGDAAPSSIGGSAITQYLVAYNEKADFTGFDGGSTTTTTTNIVLEGLTSRRTYYIRVLARNAQGSGPFCSYQDANCIDGTSVVSAEAK